MFKKNILNYFLLGLILIFSAFLYLYKLDQIPNGISSDEATIGYNAYSIAVTGKDEYGQKFPISFRFFGAYTPPLYVYLVTPLIKIFGLNIFILRLPSVIFTLLGILSIFIFTKNIYAAIIFAISPWVIFNARLGYEVTFGYITFMVGCFLLYSATKKSQISLLALVILSLSTYIAHTERYLVPLFLLTFFFIFRKYLFIPKNKTNLIIGLIILLITQIPHFYLITTPSFWVKNSDYTNSKLSVILNDSTLQYLSYLSPKNNFNISPDINFQHTIPEISNFYSWLIIPFLLGIYQLYKIKHTDYGKFILLLLLISPIPGSFSGHFISIQRVLPLIIPFILIITLGLNYLINIFPKLFSIPIFFALCLISLLIFWRSYFVLFPAQRGGWWSYGYDQIAKNIKSNPNANYLFDNNRNQTAYMSFLYFFQYPPDKIQSNFSPAFVKNYYQNTNFDSNYNIDNLSIRSIYWRKDIYISQIIIGDTLLVSEDQAKEHFFKKVWDIKDPRGKVIFSAYQTNPEEKIKSDLLKIRN